MSEKNTFLAQQEKQANKLAAQVMQITFLFFSFGKVSLNDVNTALV